ncbi:flavodoxin domain-containing protein [Amycolatopsis regifaucium]|uniref:Protoporphyrinogen oxidase n=1 Tax=Amycolatopsis regifaucium TaxID=546365 RepID=A0A154MNK1_9PSEU|nr:flavodoxin domain-containing protein [Amycolatopsis regifaucium]KZB85816.1 protoporphyrinogen oxidase [Amycolatopsis regifaucium]OKA10430.1 protoporphyrinogen oxidase [Amycolatopsis regifaucium]SFI76385.1 menaquinone-dependent protoporphyrinogen oxidase [Amycolatopsis regifaucium]
MKILVAAASRHGGTWEIAEEIGRALASELRGHATVWVSRAEDVTTVEEFDVVLVGSGVYLGQWLEQARDLVGEHAAVLRTKDVWLFSSGPVGTPPKPAVDPDPVDVARLMVSSGARGHVVFTGRIDRSLLRFTERAVVTALRVKDGDYRDWAAVRAWAGEVAAVVKPARTKEVSGHAERD